MKNKLYFLFMFFLGVRMAVSQTDLTNFISGLKKDNTLANAGIGLCIADAQTGSVIADYNKNLSLTPASTLKIITTACALQAFGKDFKYETLVQYSGFFDKTSGIITGDLYVKGSGDPTLNSEYFRKAEDSFYVVNKWANALKEKGVKKISGQLVVDVSCFDDDIPSNWIWGDMGNYFGAAPNGLSYNDNKFYVVFSPVAKNGDSMFISKTVPYIDGLNIDNQVKAGGTEDNAVVYHAPFDKDMKITGTLPVSAKHQSIEASLPNPELLLAKHLLQALQEAGIEVSNKTVLKLTADNKKQYNKTLTTIYTHKSPSLEKIVQQTNLHSNNHYAESIFRTIALKKVGYGNNFLGIQTITNQLKAKGFDINGLFITDGSGLSRSNAVTAEQLTKVLYMMYADSTLKNAFVNSLPVAGVSGSLKSFGKGTVLENNLKAKSGYITRARSYAGYMKTKSGKEICLSLIINNYNYTPTETKKKMEQIFLKVFELF